MKEFAKKVVLNEDVKKRIIQDGRQEVVKRKKKMRAGRSIAAAVLVVGIMTVPWNGLQKGYQWPLKVYAQDVSKGEEVDLDKEGTFTMEKKETPLGLGYELYALVEDGYYFKIITDDAGYGADTIFLDENHVYWFPDYWKNDNIQVYDANGNLKNADEDTRDKKARVTYCVYDEQERLRMQMTVQLCEDGNIGKGEIVELISYPQNE